MTESLGKNGSSTVPRAGIAAMNLAQIRAFHAVAMHGGFSAAAQALGVSQPAVTQHIKALEESLGTRLFTRGGSGVELTVQGHDLLPHVHRAVMMLDDLGTRISGSRALRVGHLGIGICAPYVVMPILRRFCALHPGVRLDVRLDNSSRLLDLVGANRVNLAIATLREPDPAFFCEGLVEQRVLVLVPRGHGWWDRVSVAVGELEGSDFVLREPGSMTRQLFEAGLAEAGVGVALRFALGSREAVKEAVKSGFGLGIVLDKELGRDRHLRGIPVTGAAMSAAEYVVALPDVASLGTTAAFIAAAREIYGSGSSRSPVKFP
jgi:aminoethylphosphonate catabolism LysR family transcriptional regulator